MRALVTGATGFVGSHLAQCLVAGGWKVHLIVRPESDLLPLNNISGVVTFHQHDGSTEGMQQIVTQAKPDVVFHLASLALVQHQVKDIEPLISSNILFATQLAEAMTACGVSRLVNTGTYWQHFESRGYCPVNLYSATKQAFESILQFYLETTPLKVITLKLFDTYGPGDPRPKLFTLLRKAAAEQITLAMSPGEQLIDLVYIDDVTDAFLVAADRLLAEVVEGHEEYAVTSGRPIELKELVEIYGRVMSKVIPICWGGRPYRLREVMVPWNRGMVLPGWLPKVGLEEGIRRMENFPPKCLLQT
ncbi:MAG: NAD-dependent dehydratase [Geobacter sp.]|nr:MAG: NAD-dependent dehydratase [Geobacter sp.]